MFCMPLEKEVGIPGTRTDSLGKSNKDPANLFFTGFRISETGDIVYKVRDTRATWLMLLPPHGSPGLIQMIWLAHRVPLCFTFHAVAHSLRGNTREKPSYGQGNTNPVPTPH